MVVSGPAFVASVAYMDPGKFCDEIEAGARFGYELLWVLLWSNAMAILVQYLAAKLGIATGRTLPENCRIEFSRAATIMLWLAAEVAAMATDLAEFLGAALGFYLLFGIPMLPAAVVTGICVMVILAIEQIGFQWLERTIMLFVGIIGVSYAIEMFLSKPAWRPILTDVLVPEIHSFLDLSRRFHAGRDGDAARDLPAFRAGASPPRSADREEHHHRKMELFDVLFAMNGAWLINSAMVVMAAAVFLAAAFTSTQSRRLTIRWVRYWASSRAWLSRWRSLFGAFLRNGRHDGGAGDSARILKFRISIFLRRFITMIPAVLVIAWGLDPLKTLVLSQAVLSFCFPFAMIPLLMLTRRKDLMGTHVNRPVTNYLAAVSTVIILGMNIWLLYAIAAGKS